MYLCHGNYFSVAKHIKFKYFLNLFFRESAYIQMELQKCVVRTVEKSLLYNGCLISIYSSTGFGKWTCQSKKYVYMSVLD